MKIIHQAETPEEADLIRSRLESCGIACFLKDRETIAVHPLYSNAVGGVKVLVNEEDVEAAKEILALGPLVKPDKHCPHCNSENIRSQKVNLANLFFIFFSFCIPIQKPKHICLDCKETFEDREIVKVSTAPEFEEVNLDELATSHPSNDMPVNDLPVYLRALEYAFISFLIMLLLTPIFYFRNGTFPNESHFIFGMVVGTIIGILLRYSTNLRKK